MGSVREGCQPTPHLWKESFAYNFRTYKWKWCFSTAIQPRTRSNIWKTWYNQWYKKKPFAMARTHSENERGQSNSKPFHEKTTFWYQKCGETATYVGRKCEHGPEQAECSKLDAASSWQEDMGKDSGSGVVHKLDVANRRRRKNKQSIELKDTGQDRR